MKVMAQLWRPLPRERRRARAPITRAVRPGWPGPAGRVPVLLLSPSCRRGSGTHRRDSPIRLCPLLLLGPSAWPQLHYRQGRPPQWGWAGHWLQSAPGPARSPPGPATGRSRAPSLQPPAASSSSAVILVLLLGLSSSVQKTGRAGVRAGPGPAPPQPPPRASEGHGSRSRRLRPRTSAFKASPGAWASGQRRWAAAGIGVPAGSTSMHLCCGGGAQDTRSRGLETSALHGGLNAHTTQPNTVTGGGGWEEEEGGGARAGRGRAAGEDPRAQAGHWPQGVWGGQRAVLPAGDWGRLAVGRRWVRSHLQVGKGLP